jgi:hypothetical protein
MTSQVERVSSDWGKLQEFAKENQFLRSIFFISFSLALFFAGVTSAESGSVVNSIFGKNLGIIIFFPVVLITIPFYSPLEPSVDARVFLILSGIWCFLLTYLVSNFVFRRPIRSRLIEANIEIVCPHCTNAIGLVKGWRCGWCGSLEKPALKKGELIGRLPVGECGHGTCKEKPNALECPHCGHDVIIDEARYLHARTTGKLREGVAHFTETFYQQKPLAEGQEPTAKQVERTTQADEKPKRRTPEPGDATKILDEDIS